MSSIPPAQAKPVLNSAYRTVWRWHFYAGVLVMPFLLLLSLTGGLYLFKDEIDRLAYRRMMLVAVTPAQVTPDAWLATARAATDGKPASVLIPAAPDEAVQIRIEQPDGQTARAFINPYTAALTGIVPDHGLTETIKDLHSLSLVGGPVGVAFNVVVEIVAGWAIILCATGLYLWWPRKRQGAVFVLSETDSRRRPFWRDIHAVAGFYTAGVIIFLAVTGMPWSAVWGDQFMGVMRKTALGRPPAPAAAQWTDTTPHHGPHDVGWTMEGTNLSHHHAADAPPSLTRVVQTLTEQDMARPVMISIPQQADQTWTVSTQPDHVEDTRILYVDPASGAVKADVRYGDFGPMAKAMEWGIMVHQGQQYGWLNRLVMLGGCIGVWLLAISGTFMWWKRRPPRLSPFRSGAPSALPHSQSDARYRVVLAIVTPLAILYPVTGASLLVALLVDALVSRRIGRNRPVL
ncbi:PepSY domain-containing protein [uncultured Brevundimonas sp.]|uniref:PepSY-associated TM helix domain-containing protein n=1 Tax=uncultured Brevundimonas sp. TaxID=213418 RepID=UPI00261BBD84|nr:PepSY domain-containing protein [uncultured Brevundimonas sp.]